MNKDEFEELLNFLHEDRQCAGERYETIRSGLIEFFRLRGCSEPEDLADETIDRVARKVKEIAPNYKNDPSRSRYFYGVAKNIVREYNRKKTRSLVTEPAMQADEDETEVQHRCLDSCLEQLSLEDRNLVLDYFSREGKSVINNRKTLCDRLRISPEALRIRIYRIKQRLRDCISMCLGRRN